jgi:UDP-N-acetyl-D-glucosamine dehydrogenase
MPLVLRFGEVGFPVLGFDTDPMKVELLNRGESYIKYISSELLAEVGRSRKGKGKFSATADLGRLPGNSGPMPG